jgi:arabinogalactan oligomer/maltooligosaccharide transport system permease protein
METNVAYQSSTQNKKKLGQKATNTILNSVIYVILTVMSILWVLPIVYLLYTAVRVTPDTGIINTLIPDDLQLGFGNFTRLFRDTMFSKWLGNTLLVASVSCLVTTLFVLMVSYALSRLRFKLRKPIMNVLLVLGMFPGFMSMIAIYFILKAMGLTNSLLALILVYSGGAALNYYICKGFFDTIPRSLDEAARIDGANRFQQIWNITIPGILPTIMIMFVLRMGSILNVGYEKVLLLYTDNTFEVADVFSTYTYRMGFRDQKYSLSTAVGLFNTVVNICFLMLTNWFSRKTTESGLF